jgi:hypothetical protein
VIALYIAHIVDYIVTRMINLYIAHIVAHIMIRLIDIYTKYTSRITCS